LSIFVEIYSTIFFMMQQSVSGTGKWKSGVVPYIVKFPLQSLLGCGAMQMHPRAHVRLWTYMWKRDPCILLYADVKKFGKYELAVIRTFVSMGVCCIL
jgi:hypothetical protein